MREKDLLHSYLNGKVSINKNCTNKLFDLLSSKLEIEIFESKKNKINGPDLYIDTGDKILAIEHFEFDSTKTLRKKGSKNNREIAEIDRDYNKLLNNVDSVGDYINKSYDFNVEKSLKQYKENLLKNFNNHYKNIIEYKNNIVEAGIVSSPEDILMAFFVNDSTLDGNSYYDSEEYKVLQLLPYNIEEFREVLCNSHFLDLLFIGVGIGDEKRLFVMELNKKTLLQLSILPICDDRSNLFNNNKTTISRSSVLYRQHYDSSLNSDLEE